MTQPAVPQLTPQDIKAQYGFVTALANAVPEINTLLQTAVKQQWSVSRFQSAVANTAWWKKTGDVARNWMVTQLSDPATASHEMADGAEQITQMAGDLGVSIGGDAANVWLQAKLQGMNDTQTAGYIVSREWNKNLGKVDVGGEIGNSVNQMVQMAADYGYNPADLHNQAIQQASQSATYQQQGSNALALWQSKMQNYAAVKYAPFADQIKGGQTVADIAKPYTDAYQTTLEQAPGQGIYDPAVAKALQGTPDAKGVVQPTPLWQFQQSLRKDPRWATTDNAKQSMSQAVTQIGKTFGFIGS